MWWRYKSYTRQLTIHFSLTVIQKWIHPWLKLFTLKIKVVRKSVSDSKCCWSFLGAPAIERKQRITSTRMRYCNTHGFHFSPVDQFPCGDHRRGRSSHQSLLLIVNWYLTCLWPLLRSSESQKTNCNSSSQSFFQFTVSCKDGTVRESENRLWLTLSFLIYIKLVLAKVEIFGIFMN